MLNGTRAVILAAGMGSRLRPYTEFVPKPLVGVNGIPMLHNALHQLSELGIGEATIVVGYRKEAIEQSCGHRFENVDIKYVHNPIFDRTGSAYSLWLARHRMLAGDTIFLEGDVFFEREVLDRTLRSISPTKQSVAAVAAFNVSMSGSAVELAEDGSVATFIMNQTPVNAQARGLFKTINLTRFSANALRKQLVPALHRAVESGHHKAYVEQILAPLVETRELQLSAADCSDTRWFEIDNEDDLRLAEEIFALPTGGAHRTATSISLPAGARR
ncbi:phosphocholine cytidylyltransferase family protein [Bradyrhizobium sp. CB3481]|uniref:phosphocholine cytidylyltransferase family protein n=1 Tax=Bradyrhizobium sp. CB3481 TaxID=3039158 RepID=UPI0024B0B9EE|nr:phosphocholine cytidylyltransferase family protein [Bradyrhizobium sp. CB3481]WFU14859.1 phosphocholine cytidylyltransferase family protein [Bradyrhizobium sp. CB3481]